MPLGDLLEVGTATHVILGPCAAAVEHVGQMLDQASRLDGETEMLVGPGVDDGVDDLPAFRDAFAARTLGVAGANPNPMFNAMMALAKLRELGLAATGEAEQQRWCRPALGPLAGLGEG